MTLLAIGGALELVHLAHNGLKIGVPQYDAPVSLWVHMGVLVAAVGVMLWRVICQREERLAWSILLVGMFNWTLASVFWKWHYALLNPPPFPSICDYLWITLYPASYAHLILLVRSRVRRFHASLWLDGTIGALAVGSVTAAVVFGTVVANTGGSAATVATNLSYPIGDLLQLAFIVGIFALTGWRPGRAWALLAGGLACMAVSDSNFLIQAASGKWVDGEEFTDAIWTLGFLLMATASVSAFRAGRHIELRGWRMLVAPALFTSMALIVLAKGSLGHVPLVATVLALAAVCAVVIRAGLLMRENITLLEASRAESLTDALTGLGNRRALMHDLEDALIEGANAAPRRLLLFDLNGFKKYNDTFGHPAGDDLLARLGRSLADAAAGHARAYRLGGDEFCVLADHNDMAELYDAQLVGALFEQGDGFVISASHGVVYLPAEAVTPSEVLGIADERMYMRKSRGSGRMETQTHQTLVRCIHARNSDLSEELDRTARLAQAVASRLGLAADEIGLVTEAAQLVDLGKLALPDAILLKPGPLSADEWEFVQRYPQVGARILAAATSLRHLVPIVRGSRERFDGRGYPDALAGEAIPLAARIVGACRAYIAMISPRPHRPAMTPELAIGQLRMEAGSRFDPAVVDAIAPMYTTAVPLPTMSPAPATEADPVGFLEMM